MPPTSHTCVSIGKMQSEHTKEKKQFNIHLVVTILSTRVTTFDSSFSKRGGANSFMISWGNITLEGNELVMCI